MNAALRRPRSHIFAFALGALLSTAGVARAQLEDPDWDEGQDHPAQLEHQAEAAEGEEIAADGAAAGDGEGELPASDEDGAQPASPTEDAGQPTPVEGSAELDTSADDAVSERRVEPALLELGGIAGMLYQRLTYHDDLYGFMRPYGLNSAKAFGGYVTLYPLARADFGVLSGLGVELRYAQMLTFDSQRADGSTFPTRSRELVAGFRYRIACDHLLDRGIDASVGLGGGSQVFNIGSAIALPNVDNRASVPARHYRFLRVDTAARVALDLGFFLNMHIGVRMIFDAGDVDSADWFPHGRRWGLESGLHLGYALPKGIEVSVGFEAQRYMYRLRPEPGDANVVGGLLDRYVLAQARLGWRY
ncbi:MAG: hypothetical protein R3B40_09075 [Polyangiales bacterium]|nr:hypothetical protein [Myxococcales bacterium]